MSLKLKKINNHRNKNGNYKNKRNTKHKRNYTTILNNKADQVKGVHASNNNEIICNQCKVNDEKNKILQLKLDVFESDDKNAHVRLLMEELN
jgi:hypothetical protein